MGDRIFSSTSPIEFLTSDITLKSSGLKVFVSESAIDSLTNTFYILKVCNFISQPSIEFVTSGSANQRMQFNTQVLIESLLEGEFNTERYLNSSSAIQFALDDIDAIRSYTFHSQSDISTSITDIEIVREELFKSLSQIRVLINNIALSNYVQLESSANITVFTNAVKVNRERYFESQSDVSFDTLAALNVIREFNSQSDVLLNIADKNFVLNNVYTTTSNINIDINDINIKVLRDMISIANIVTILDESRFRKQILFQTHAGIYVGVKLNNDLDILNITDLIDSTFEKLDDAYEFIVEV